MNNEFDGMARTTMESLEQTKDVIGKLFTVAQPGAVFGEPVERNGSTVITASEVSVAMGYGSGMGGGSGPQSDREPSAAGQEEAGGFGGGSGGGGVSNGRPVAVVRIGADGTVDVEPIVDVTKIALAFFTTFGSMALMLIKMARQVREV